MHHFREKLVELPVAALSESYDTSASSNFDHTRDELMTTIFCAEGNATALRLQTALFGMSGYAVLVANDPETAIAMAKMNSFDVAVVDDHFQHASGMYLAREIRRVKPNVRIVFVSSIVRSSWEDMGEADDYVLEGESFEVLLQKVQNLLAPAFDHEPPLTRTMSQAA
jgi:DNA-binding response OmpR family regulator